jgi:hypothetical protein
LARLEFSGVSNLFLSYYGSQVSAQDFGPVALYEFDSDVFKSYFDMFLTIWSCNEATEISLTKDFTSMHNLKLYIENKLEISITDSQINQISIHLIACFNIIKEEFKNNCDNDKVLTQKVDVIIGWLSTNK